MASDDMATCGTPYGKLGKRFAEGRWVWIVRLVRACAGLPSGAVVGTTSFLEVAVDDARLEIGTLKDLKARFDEWNAKMLPLVADSYTHAIEARHQADHYGQ